MTSVDINRSEQTASVNSYAYPISLDAWNFTVAILILHDQLIGGSLRGLREYLRSEAGFKTILGYVVGWVSENRVYPQVVKWIWVA
ncbi:hypothetical protein PISMIDRAFT_280620 [Pisolithus microcarpus 441]|uniref:Uncharacterized protein n=1 Tax=Pisolithus microcarpus 441 TaxID=765257 RepID=A0A0C9YQC7_9AGAM|nr:hypothetical protein PISMIDRAFT_280620 [Pisolithus microcarpus 441]